MNRIHRALVRRAAKIDPDQIADKADDYLDGFRMYRKYLKGTRGLKTEQSIKNHIKKIDALEREMDKMEERIERLEERKALEAAKLEAKLKNNLEIVREYLDPVEYKDFVR